MMLALVQGLWRDEQGLILSAELVMILTVGVLGLIVGLVNLQNALLGEMNDLASAFRALNQSYSTPSFSGCWKYCGPTSYTLGSCYVDVYEAGCVSTDPCANGTAGCYGMELNCGANCLPAQPVPGNCTNTVPAKPTDVPAVTAPTPPSLNPPTSSAP